jgi:diamine N-acetyltransferase
VTLKGKHIYLRALEPEDLDFVFEIENNENIWEISNTIAPFSKYVIKRYLENAHKDIFETKQLRLVISDNKENPLGLIDLYDFDFINKRAGIGIIIKDAKNRHKGFGLESLQILVKYSFEKLYLHQLYCNISEENNASIKLFEKVGFTQVGLKKDWNVINGEFKNEYLYQLIS